MLDKDDIVPCLLTPCETYVTQEEAAGYYASLPQDDSSVWEDLFLNARTGMSPEQFKQLYECQWPTEKEDHGKR